MLAIAADIHSNVRKADRLLTAVQDQSGRSLGEGDVLLVLGDVLGAVWSRRRNHYERLALDKKMIAWCDRQPFKVVAVKGNHDTARRFRTLCARDDEWQGLPVKVLGENLTYLDDGLVYDVPLDVAGDETASVLALGGAFGHNQTRGREPVMARLAFKQRYAHLANGKPFSVDIVASHDCPSSSMGWLRTVFGETVANQVFDEVKDNVEFGRWYFGHHHVDVDAGHGVQGLYRRVAIVDVDEKSMNNRTSTSWRDR